MIPEGEGAIVLGGGGIFRESSDKQALVCLSDRQILDVSRGRSFHCKQANTRLFSLILLAYFI